MTRLASANGNASSKADTWDQIWDMDFIREDDPVAELAGRSLQRLMTNPRIRESDIMAIQSLLHAAASYAERERSTGARMTLQTATSAAKPYYPHDTTWPLERGEKEIDVTVEYAVDDYATPASGMSGPPENYDPGSGWVFAINPIANDITLTETEMDQIHDWLSENHEEDNGYDY